MAGRKKPSCPLEAVLFDLDGTLLDYEGASHVALNAPLQRFGVTVSLDLHASIIGSRSDVWSRVILSACGIAASQMTPEQYVREYMTQIATLYSTLTLMPGAQRLVHVLQSRGVPMAVATSSMRESCTKKLAVHPTISDAMKAVVCGDDPTVKCGKPAPDIFLEAARALGVPPERCAVFEDSPQGVVAGRAAGAFVVGVPDERFMQPNKSPEHDAMFAQADVLLGSLEELDVDALFPPRPPPRPSPP